MKSSLEGSIADQVLAEAAIDFSEAVTAPPGHDINFPTLPGEDYLGELNESIIILAGVAKALSRTEPWVLASRGVREVGNGLHATKLFSDPKLQREIMRDVARRKSVFKDLEKDWFIWP